MDKQTAADRADELFNSGWNCAESVFMAVHEQRDDAEAPCHLLTALGGGMGSGRTCGALTGAAVALGLEYGRGDADEPLEPAYCASERLCEHFKLNQGATDCAEVTSWDRDDSIRHRECVEAVRKATELACELIERPIRDECLDG